jgi:chemotaxis protein histidine kinase CheA
LVRAGRQAAAAGLDDKGVRAAVFEPGFSTRPHSDPLAGRGMGLNIVERTVAHMGGEVKLEYEAGVFTRFRLSIPLTATIRPCSSSWVAKSTPCQPRTSSKPCR